MTWWMWVLAGLALFAFELLTPGGFFVIFFGVGALVVGLLSGLGLIHGPVEWLVFSGVSIVSLLLFRKPLLDWMKQREGPRAPVDSLIGETAVLTEDLPAGGVGKAELRGTSWNVRAREGTGLPRGQRTKVERVDGLTLWVRVEQ
ncbi:MAG TPA: NfeD family protein [Verrucomicrobiae bacterium]|nr:NfeD family protein [Verrucomicrobiae bacterium]